MDETKSMRDEFVVEAKEHLEIVEQVLLVLEKETENIDQEDIGRIFRSIHSIKGAAGFLALNKVNKLSHVMETLLSRMREGEILPEKMYIDALFGGLDRLNIMIHDVENSEDVDIEDTYGLLHSLTEEDEIKSPESLALSEKYHFRIPKLPETHDNLYALTYDIDTLSHHTGDWAINQFKELSSTGEILACQFMKDHCEHDPDFSNCTCTLLYSSVLDEDVVRRIPSLGAQNIIALLPDQILLTDPEQEERIIGAENAPPSMVASRKVGEDRKKDTTKIKSETTSIQKKSKDDPNVEPASSGQDTLDTIRVQVSLLDRLMALAGELVLVRNQHMMVVDSNDATVRSITQRLDIVTSELQEAIMRTRMQPIGHIFNKLPRIARDLGHKLHKKIEIQTIGNEVEVDKTILEALADPLTHLIRNCCDHGIETVEERQAASKPPAGTVTVRAFHEAGKINIIIQDDGHGIDVAAVKRKALAQELKTDEELARMSDKEIFSLILLPGFSTAKEVSEVSGRGVGMDVVRNGLDQFGGTLELDSTPGKGTKVSLQLPLTLAIIPCLITVVDNRRYAIPQVNLEELVCLYDDDIKNKIECANSQEVFRLRDKLLPLVRFREILKRSEPFSEEVRNEITTSYCSGIDDDNLSSLNFSVVKAGNNKFGLIVDKVIGTEEIVVKPMHPSVKHLSIFSGATVMGDGQVALILDIEGIFRHAGIEMLSDRQEIDEQSKSTGQKTADSQQFLLFRYGEREQFAISLPLIKRIEYVSSSQIEYVGEKKYVTVDGQSTRILCLDSLLNVSKGMELENFYLLLPKYAKRPFGIVINKLVDICQDQTTMDQDTHKEDGLLGSAVVGNILTLFLDVYRLIEKAEPDWFAERKEETPPPEEQKKILLLEDMPFFRKMIKGYFEADNYKVYTAENGFEGLAVLAKKQIDLIVSDLEMPEMDGFTFIKEVRSNGHGNNLPALALTSLTSDEDRERALSAGFDHYEIKIDREELLAVTSRILNEHSASLSIQ